MQHRKIRQVKTTDLYFIATLVTLFFAMSAIIITNGSFFRLFFFSDQDDSLMDFFNSIIEVHTKKPYSEFGVLYPPLANCFFYVLQLFIPNTIKEAWPKNHKETLYLVGTSNDIRMSQPCMVVFLLTFLLFIFLFIVIIRKYTKSCSDTLIFSLLFSHAMIQILEHGNVVLIAFVFAMIFYIYHDNDNPVLRELSLISLAISFGFKLYPAILGMVLLKKRQYKDAVKAIIYGILFTILPLLFLDGISGLPIWFNNVFAFGTESFSKTENLVRIASILFCVIIILWNTLPSKSNSYFKLTESQYIMIICWLMILISGNVDGSTLIFVIMPFLIFCNEEKYINRYNIPELIIYLSCLLPLGINKLEYFFLPIFLPI